MASQPSSKLYLVFPLVMALLLPLYACGDEPTSHQEDWPPMGDPCEWVNIDTGKLKPSVTIMEPVEMDPYSSVRRPFDFYEESARGVPPDPLELRPGVTLHVYPHVTVQGHYFGTGTHVYYLPERDAFYLWGDDFMGHWDGMVGPFDGDPRVELPQAASPPGTLGFLGPRSGNCD